MTIYQLTNVDGEHVGLFQSQRHDADVKTDIQRAIVEANGDAEIYNEILEGKNIFPVWAEEVFTDII